MTIENSTLTTRQLSAFSHVCLCGLQLYVESKDCNFLVSGNEHNSILLLVFTYTYKHTKCQHALYSIHPVVEESPLLHLYRQEEGIYSRRERTEQTAL